MRVLGILAAMVAVVPASRAQSPAPVMPAGPGRIAISPGNPIVSDSYPVTARGHYSPFLGQAYGPIGMPCGIAPLAIGGMMGRPVAVNPYNGLPYEHHVVLRPVTTVPSTHAMPAEIQSPPIPPDRASRSSPPEVPEGPASPPTVPQRSAALMLVLVDIDDPVPVGENVTYLAIVRNQGERDAQDVALTIQLPDGVRFLASSGPSDSRESVGEVDFEPVPSLPPGEELRWRLDLRAERPGQLSTRAELSSSFLDTPAFDVEPTVIVPKSEPPGVDADPVELPIPSGS